MAVPVRRAGGSRWAVKMCLVGASLACTSCDVEPVVEPVIPAQAHGLQFKPLAFTADVNLQNGRVSIVAPAVAGASPPALARGGDDLVSPSLLGSDALRLVPTNLTFSEVGAYAPNKIRVTFDITIQNKLPFVAMTTPTWPLAPAPGVILFPLETEVTAESSDVADRDGTSVLVSQSGGGQRIIPSNAASVVPSIDWNGTGATGSGSPYSFFNDTGCSAVESSDCFRWEAFDRTIQPGAESSSRTIGFDIDASVVQFRARMVVAADLVAPEPASVVLRPWKLTTDSMPRSIGTPMSWVMLRPRAAGIDSAASFQWRLDSALRLGRAPE
jgi:hypothetical protein